MKRQWRIFIALAALIALFVVWFTVTKSKDQDSSTMQTRPHHPDTTDALGWLNGVWYEDCTHKIPMISFSTSDKGLHTLTGSEGKIQSDPPIAGLASVSFGENGFTHVSPPGWATSYLRLKPEGDTKASGAFVTHTPDTTISEDLTLVKCPA